MIRFCFNDSSPLLLLLLSMLLVDSFLFKHAVAAYNCAIFRSFVSKWTTGFHVFQRCICSWTEAKKDKTKGEEGIWRNCASLVEFIQWAREPDPRFCCCLFHIDCSGLCTFFVIIMNILDWLDAVVVMVCALFLLFMDVAWKWTWAKRPIYLVAIASVVLCAIFFSSTSSSSSISAWNDFSSDSVVIFCSCRLERVFAHVYHVVVDRDRNKMGIDRAMKCDKTRYTLQNWIGNVFCFIFFFFSAEMVQKLTEIYFVLPFLCTQLARHTAFLFCTPVFVDLPVRSRRSSSSIR